MPAKRPQTQSEVRSASCRMAAAIHRGNPEEISRRSSEYAMIKIRTVLDAQIGRLTTEQRAQLAARLLAGVSA